MGIEQDSSGVSALQPMPAGTSAHPAASLGMAVLAVHVLPDYALCVSHGFVPVFDCMRVNDLKCHLMLIGLHPYELLSAMQIDPSQPCLHGQVGS